jgi:hypothetical protein
VRGGVRRQRGGGSGRAAVWGWLALYTAGAHGRQAARAWYAAVAGGAALGAVFAACALLYPKTAGELPLLIAVTALEEQRNGEWRYLKFPQVTSLAHPGHQGKHQPPGP